MIVLVVILSFTLFSLRTIELDFRTNKTYITETDQEIIESGEIKMGGSVFFRSKNKYIEKIESKNPYIKVVNIETVFPSGRKSLRWSITTNSISQMMNLKC